ncbi:hypothetical protein NMG60_11030099 [Bertholletia excelsa]
MNGVLLRTGSVPVHHHSPVHGSLRASLSVHDSVAGGLSWEGIRRTLSEADATRSESDVAGRLLIGSRSFPGVISEKEYLFGDVGSLTLNEREFYWRNYDGDRQESGTAGEELGFSGGGPGKGRKSGGSGGGDDSTFTGENADRSKIGEYYQEMLKTDPTNSLLLRNYGTFLHEVERDLVKAEEYYARSILASPGDGEVLSLYGKLIWETQGDEDRAKSYFDQAVRASPDDCMVLGSYAHFMWEADEEEDDDEEEHKIVTENHLSPAAAMIEAF